MGQLTLSRFRGDTTFEFVMRLLSTLFGGITGLAVWYAHPLVTYGHAVEFY